MAKTSGNKPRGIVEKTLYSGRKSFSGPDGLPKGESDDADINFPQNENDQPLKRNSGDVKSDWRRGDDVGGSFGAGGPGVTDRKGFDRDTSRKGNDAPSSRGGRESFPSPFSAAGRNVK